MYCICRAEIYKTLIGEFPAKSDPSELRINFEQFCVLASESSWIRTKSNGISCESEIPSVWNILCRKTSNFLRRVIVHPFNRFLGIFDFQQFPTIFDIFTVYTSRHLNFPFSHFPRLSTQFHLFRRAGKKCNLRSAIRDLNLFRLDQFLCARIREKRHLYWCSQ